jgi:acyl-CoA reductase-like NAD-dependent aldehyde dehydrogenase
MEWRSVTLELPLPAFAEAAVVAGYGHLQHISLTHIVAAAGLYLLLRTLLQRSVPSVILPFEDDAEEKDVIEARTLLDPRKVSPRDAQPGKMRCWDPCTMQDLGVVDVFTAADVHSAVGRARLAQETWKKSSFAQRRHLLNVISRCITENMDAIVRVACRDSGKAKVDAYLGEVLVTLEKIRWLCSQGERFLVPEYRESGLLNLHKTSRVEYHPVGVVGAIVPWNYPFHNVFNPLLAAV